MGNWHVLYALLRCAHHYEETRCAVRYTECGAHATVDEAAGSVPIPMYQTPLSCATVCTDTASSPCPLRGAHPASHTRTEQRKIMSVWPASINQRQRYLPLHPVSLRASTAWKATHRPAPAIPTRQQACLRSMVAAHADFLILQGTPPNPAQPQSSNTTHTPSTRQIQKKLRGLRPIHGCWAE